MISGRYEKTKKENIKKKVTEGQNPHSKHQPALDLDPSGEIVPAKRQSTFCPQCNNERILPMRLAGFTIYRCMNRRCGFKWRDSYNQPGATLKPREWRSIRDEIGLEHGRILV